MQRMSYCTGKKYIYICVYENSCSEKKRELKTKKEKKTRTLTIEKKATFLGIELKKKREKKKEKRKRQSKREETFPQYRTNITTNIFLNFFFYMFSDVNFFWLNILSWLLHFDLLCIFEKTFFLSNRWKASKGIIISKWALTKFSYSSFGVCVSVFSCRASYLFLSANAYLSLISLLLSSAQS